MHPKQLLDRYGIEPKKSLGQNFLFDENILARIADAANIAGEDEVLEIGPGVGSLTRLLAQRAASVTAVELDERFIPILQSELAVYGNVRIIHGDILQQNPADLFSGAYKVVANVPYYITGAILRHLLAAESKPSLMVLTVQKEVAMRMTATPPNMSLLSVSVQFYGKVEIVAYIKAGAFWPRPDVDSAVVRIVLPGAEAQTGGDGPGALSAQVDERRFFHVVKGGFSQKRKQLKNNLRSTGYREDEIEAALKEAGINGRRRAETLSLQEWLAVYRTLTSDNP